MVADALTGRDRTDALAPVSTRLRLRWDRLKFDMPLVQRVARSANAARYTNTLSILTRSGVPLVEAMHIASGVV